LSKSLSSRLSAVRLLVIYITLLAFGLQSYVTQTHIHLAPDSFASFAKLGANKQSQPDKFPANGDPANCPICQEIAHTGQFVTPAAAVLLLPSVAVSVIKIVANIPAIAQDASHAWRSRAPPKA
jgi:hypothetical protein